MLLEGVLSMAKVLIVDDNKNNLYLLGIVLQAEGHQVIMAEQGEEALSLVRQDPVDVVISDIMMPVMNGFRLCREMKRDTLLRQTPFIFYTATFLDKEDEELAMKLGASRFIAKPMESTQFLSLINQVLDEHSKGQLPVSVEPPVDVESILEMYESSLTRKLAETVEKLQQERRSLQVSERKLREAQEIAQMGHWELDLQTDHLYWSDEIYRLFGLKPQATEATLEAFFENIHSEDRDSVRQTYRESLAKNMSYAIDYRLQLKDGTIKYVHERRQTQFDDDGRPLYSAGTVQDITERKQAEEERESLIAQLQDKTAEQESFIYTVSHDLKTPLVTISGFLGLVEKAFASGDEAEFKSNIVVISNAVKRMKQLLDEVLELSRIGVKKNPTENINLGWLIQKAIENVSGRIEAAGATIELESDFPEITAAPKDLLHVMENLIDNAIKFSSSAAGRAVVSIGARRGEGEWICYVKDNGIGIDPSYRPKLFKLFEKLDSSSDGTGVGLAIVKRIVEMNGGKIWVESEGLGCGSTFCFSLPEKGQMG